MILLEKTLTTLNLCNSQIGAEGAIRLANALRQNTVTAFLITSSL